MSDRCIVEYYTVTTDRQNGGKCTPNARIILQFWDSGLPENEHTRAGRMNEIINN